MNGDNQGPTFAEIDRAWAMGPADADLYSATSRKLSPLFLPAGGPLGEAYTRVRRRTCSSTQ